MLYAYVELAVGYFGNFHENLRDDDDSRGNRMSAHFPFYSIPENILHSVQKSAF